MKKVSLVDYGKIVHFSSRSEQRHERIVRLEDVSFIIFGFLLVLSF